MHNSLYIQVDFFKKFYFIVIIIQSKRYKPYNTTLKNVCFTIYLTEYCASHVHSSITTLSLHEYNVTMEKSEKSQFNLKSSASSDWKYEMKRF